MTIQAGSRLGPYEIVARLGAGGMGEVFRARDTRVGREVAVKILPASFASDEDRRQRFEQEARAAAALNHPNLLTIHDVGASDGTPYIVSELLEGETLREKLEGDGVVGSPVPTRKAIEWAAAVATGLAAAHDKGVVHRDLKPDNIFITTDGRVKILDFGLAKLTSAFQEGVTDSRTAQRNTSPGAVMGTVGYMSPEQVRGQNLDQSTDIFSLGAILYEMLSGRRAFRGESTADTMSAILREDPPELATSGVDVSAGLDRIVRRCLEKNPTERFHSAHDLAYALEAISGSSMRSAPNVTIPEARRNLRPVAIGAALVLIAGASFLLGRTSATRGGGGESGGARPARLAQVTSLSGNEIEVSISPDGSTILYSALAGDDQDIFSQRAGGRNAVNLTNTPEREGHATFSPDGSMIAFERDRGIWLMGATGDSVRRLTDRGFNPSWSHDGRSIVYSTIQISGPGGRQGFGELWRVDLGSGEQHQIEVGVDAVQPSCSPDGKWIAFWGLKTGTAHRVIYSAPSSGGSHEVLVDDEFMNWTPVWAPDSRSVYFASDRGGSMNIWLLPIDSGTGRAAGEAEPVTIAPGWNAPFAVANTGAIAFVARTSSSTLERRPIDLSKRQLGSPEIIVEGTANLSGLDVSPDGRSLALMLSDPNEDIVVFDIDAPDRPVRLTNDAFRDRLPKWSADGSRVFFFSDRSGGYATWSVRPDGSDLRNESRDYLTLCLPSPDGAYVLGRTVGERWGLIELTSNPEPKAVDLLPPIREDLGFEAVVWTVDGKRIIGKGASAASGDRADRLDGIWAYTIATKSYDLLQGDPRARFVAMTKDGNHLLKYNRGDVELVDLTTGKTDVVGNLPRGTFGLSVTLSRDETSLYSTMHDMQSDIWMLEPAEEARDR